MIEIENLFLKYNKQEKDVLKGISFKVKAECITGLIGHNGAGKTTIIKMICGLLSPSTYDKFEILGQNVQNKKIFSNIGLILGVEQLYEDLTAYENIQYYLKLNGVKKNREQIAVMLKKVGLLEDSSKLVREYSTGMKQKLNIAKVLLCDKNVIILDEPTAGMDPVSKNEVNQLLISISKKNKITILISSHSMKEVEKICDNIIFVNEGNVLYSGETRALLDTYGKKIKEMILSKVDGRKMIIKLKENKISFFYYLEQGDSMKIVLLELPCKVKLDEEKCNKIVYRDLELEDIFFHQTVGRM